MKLWSVLRNKILVIYVTMIAESRNLMQRAVFQKQFRELCNLMEGCNKWVLTTPWSKSAGSSGAAGGTSFSRLFCMVGCVSSCGTNILTVLSFVTKNSQQTTPHCHDWLCYINTCLLRVLCVCPSKFFAKSRASFCIFVAISGIIWRKVSVFSEVLTTPEALWKVQLVGMIRNFLFSTMFVVHI